jgi:hypothetical protein
VPCTAPDIVAFAVHLKILFYAIWIPVVAAATFAAVMLAWRETRIVAAALLAGAIAFVGLVVYPRTIDDTAAAANRYERFRATQGTRPGGPVDCLIKLEKCVHERVWAELRRLIPEHDRYYVQAKNNLIAYWTFTSLLPRVAVASVHDADWVVSMEDPSTLGVRYSRMWTIRRVYSPGGQELILAKVAR